MGMILKAAGDGKGIDAQEVRRALGLLADPKYGIQLQYAPFHGKNFQTFSGTPAGLEEAAQWVNTHGDATGVYYVHNPVCVGLAKQARVGDVICRRWMLVDVDRHKTDEVLGKDRLTGVPVRNSDLSATDAEHEAARSLTYDVVEYLDGLRWPAPLVVDSGNGFQLLYRVDLNNDDLARASIKLALTKLAARFNDDRGEIDTACFDARRLAKLPGTWARRGPAWQDRPYRMAKLIGGPA